MIDVCIYLLLLEINVFRMRSSDAMQIIAIISTLRAIEANENSFKFVSAMLCSCGFGYYIFGKISRSRINPSHQHYLLITTANEASKKIIGNRKSS